MAKKTLDDVLTPVTTIDANALAQAIITATEAAQGPRKKTIVTRKSKGPWTNKDGSAKPRLKRRMYQHGVEMHADNLSSAEIDALNKLRPGSFCDGFITVVRRKDKGLNLDYPIKTSAQRLKLLNDYGLNSLVKICEQCVYEYEHPKVVNADLDED